MQKYQRLIYTLLFIIALFIVFEAFGFRAHFNLAFIKQTILTHPIIGLVLFVAMFALGNLIQIPGLIFLVAAVLALGQVLGGLATYLAASISCAFTFLVIRAIGDSALWQLKQSFVTKVLLHLNSKPVRSVFILRTLLQTAPALNCTLAMSGITFKQYMIGTLLGLPLPIMAYCVFFDAVVKMLNI